MPKSYLTEDEKKGLSENALYVAESHAAGIAGDDEAAWAWLRLAVLPAHALLSLKWSEGPDFIRNMGLKTQAADELYGPGWLEKDDYPPGRSAHR